MIALRCFNVAFVVALAFSGCRTPSVEESNSEEQAANRIVAGFQAIKKLADFDPNWLSLGSKIDRSHEFVTKLMRLAKTNRDEFLKFKNFVLKNPGKVGPARKTLDLVVGSESEWLDFVRRISSEGVPDQALANHLVPVMENLDLSTKSKIWKEINLLYPKAYKNKHRGPLGDGIAPKRALDLILRFTLPPEAYFQSVKNPTDARRALNLFISDQHSKVFSGTEFGSYTGDDVISLAKYIQNFLRTHGSAGQEILLKGSLPTGRANLAKRNPFDSLADSVLQGMNSSYSDVDMLVPASLQKPIQSIADKSYSALVSQQAKNIVSSTGAKPSFQTHVWPDLFAELDGAFMSPIGIRITKDGIFVNIYRSGQKNELPAKSLVDTMTVAQQSELRSKWITSIPIE